MDDLALWLGEQLDEDERIARAATPGPWKLARQRGVEWVSSAEYWAVADCSDADPARENAEHIAAWDPARVLREIDAKRQLVKLHGRATLRAGGGAQYFETTTVCRSCEANYQFPELSWPCPTLRLLALPYADRPGYREQWKP